MHVSVRIIVHTCVCMCVRVYFVCVCECVCVDYARACFSIFLVIIAVDLEVKPQISLSNEDGGVLSPVLEMAKSNRTSM